MDYSQFWYLVAFIYASHAVPIWFQLTFASIALITAWWMHDK